MLAIDQGTTSTRALLFNASGHVCGSSQKTIQQYFPNTAWVEHDPEELWQSTIDCCREAVGSSGLLATDVAAIGISNQRETTIIWDRNTGVPIYPAVVWQDRRTAEYCKSLAAQPGLQRRVTQKTGLLLDPYFSASKIHWILNHVSGARQRASQGDLAFGTVDAFLLWRLTGGAVHATDVTNASRTLLFNLQTQAWDKELLTLFDIPAALLPEVYDNAYAFGVTEPSILGAAIPITGMAGDQQAAAIGQACFSKGMIKSTYGTGSFVLMNTGSVCVQSQHRLISTIAYRLKGQVSYGLEGSNFIAGAAIQWLRDAVHLVHSSEDTAVLAASVPDSGGVYLVPAFTGLGAPYWAPDVRGALLGLTRDTRTAHIVRAALEAICYQTRDLLEAMQLDSGVTVTALRVDGGMVSNDWFLQCLADLLGKKVERPSITESSVLGAAMLAGLGIGIYSDIEAVMRSWEKQQEFQPKQAESERDAMYEGWKKAVRCILNN